MKLSSNGLLRTLAVSTAIAALSLISSSWTGPAFAAGHSIVNLAIGSYSVTYFDVSSSFAKSQQGYGGPGHSGGDGDSLVRVVDVGNYEASPTDGDLCINFYVFDDDQEMQECCSCPTTADEVDTFSTINELTSNPQFSSPLGVGVIKMVGSSGNDALKCTSGGNGTLGTAGTLVVSDLADGLTGWSSHTETMASNNPHFDPPYGFVTSTSVAHFAQSPLDNTELSNLTSVCQTIELHASGRGICSCKFTPPPPPVVPVQLFLGYANNFNGGPPHLLPPPTPFGQGSVNFFLGVPTGQGDFDSGAILVKNTSGQNLTIDSVTLDFGPTCTIGTGTTEGANCPGFQFPGSTDPWASGNPSGLVVPGLVLGAAQTAILAQTNTGMGTTIGESNFDTTDLPPGVSPPTGTCLQDGVIPVLHFTFHVGAGSPQTINVSDTGQILNADGFDKALCPKTAPCNAGAVGSTGCGIEGHDYVQVYP